MDVPVGSIRSSINDTRNQRNIDLATENVFYARWIFMMDLYRRWRSDLIEFYVEIDLWLFWMLNEQRNGKWVEQFGRFGSSNRRQKLRAIFFLLKCWMSRIFFYCFEIPRTWMEFYLGVKLTWDVARWPNRRNCNGWMGVTWFCGGSIIF